MADDIEKFNAVIDPKFHRKREVRLAAMKKGGNT